MTIRMKSDDAPKPPARKWPLGTAALALATMSSSAAHAGSFALREQSTIGVGMDYAGAAAGAAGLSSMYWNPATVTMHPGWNGQQSFTVISPYAKIKTTGSAIPGIFGDSGNIGQTALVPSGAASVQLTDRLFLGLVTGAPFGLVTSPEQAWRGELYARSSRVFSFNATPSVAYKINDWLSIGAGLQIEYFKTRLNSALPVTANPGTYPSFGLEGDNIGVGATAGVTVTPFVGTTIGLGYRSTVEHELTGTAGAAFPLTPPTPIKTTLHTPDMVSLGITQVITPDFSLSGELEWTNWSRFGTFPVYNQNTGAAYTLLGSPVTLAFRYRDSWFVSLGGEYKLNSAWTVRAGLGYETTPIRTADLGVRVPDTNRITTSLGLSYKWSDKLTFDLGYAHLFMKKANIAIVPGNPAYNAAFGPYLATGKPHIDMVSLGFSYSFGDTIAKEKPIVAKY